jgi:hypothetical protein
MPKELAAAGSSELLRTILGLDIVVRALESETREISQRYSFSFSYDCSSQKLFHPSHLTASISLPD